MTTLLLVSLLSLHADDPLPQGARARLGTTKLRHVNVTSIAFAPDGKTIASVGDDGRFRLWDTATGKLVRTLIGHAGRIQTVAYAPTGKLLASAGTDAIRFWDLSTGKQSHAPIQRYASFLTFSPDGKILAFAEAEADTGATLWDIATATPLRTLDHVVAAAFSPTGNTIATVVYPQRGGIKLWDTKTGKELWYAKTDLKYIFSVAFSPDGKTLVSAGGPRANGGPIHGEITFWDPVTGTERHTMQGLPETVTHSCFSPDGKYLVSTGKAGPLTLWDWQADGGPLRLWKDAGTAANVTFSLDSRRLAWTSGNAIRLLDLPLQYDGNAPGGHTHPANFVAFTPDGKTVVSAAETVRVWDAVTGAERRAAPSYLHELTAAALAGDGKTVLTSSCEGILRWDVATMKALRRFGTREYYATAMVLSPDGTTLATSLYKRTFVRSDSPATLTGRMEYGVHLWDVASGTKRARFAEQGWIRNLAYSPDGQQLAATYVGPNDGSIHILDATTGALITRWRPPAVSQGWHAYPAFSPDGKLFASGNPSGVVMLWAADSRKLLRTLRDRYSQSFQLIFSPDSTMMMVVGEAEPPRLWEVATGKLLHEFAYQERVVTAAFSPDSRWLATAGEDTTILIWDVKRGPATPSLAADELDNLWLDLGEIGRGTMHSYVSQRAIRRLAAAPQAAVAFLTQRLKPDLPRDERLQRLISDLDSGDFKVREAASRELASRGKSVAPAVRQALAEKLSTEQRRRLREVLIAVVPLPQQGKRYDLSTEQQRLMRVVVLLDRIGTPEAVDLLRYLVETTELQMLLNDPRVGGGVTHQAKEAIMRLK